MEKIDLQRIYKRKKTERDIFQELMTFKVQEILLIANYYDAYTIEREGQFTDKVYGEYLQVNLYTAPRFTAVASEKEALEILAKRSFHLIIIMAGLDKGMPQIISQHIQAIYPHIPQLMLVNNNADLAYFERIKEKLNQTIERIFVWNGSAKIFLAMAKYIEDKKNLDTDTRLGDIRVILLVEDSIRYYSRYLPLLYSEIVTQTQELIRHEPENDDLSLIMKIRVRPKVILVSTFEDAVNIIDKYRNNLIGVISDVKYARNGKEDENAGVELIRYTQQADDKIPCLLQSHDTYNHRKARQLHADFINKNSLTLEHDITDFIKERLGFGDFIFKDANGKPIDKASSIEEFKQKLVTIPDASLKYHSIRNGVSTWLMARGEISLAKKLRRYRFEDFQTLDQIREFIIHVFESSALKKMRGKIINFRPQWVNSSRYITSLGKGSFGGKGRGMAFLCNFIENVYLKKLIPDLHIAIPKTAIIGVEEYDNFIEINNLIQIVYTEKNYEVIKEAFLKARLAPQLIQRLRNYLEVMKKPLAVRSSGLFEDSLSQPFAGVYATFLIPNNHPDPERRLEELETAIKLVYASIYTEESRAYFNAVDYVIEEEKMAVIIQEVTGHEHHGKFYPTISGVAQSYNFYPFSYIKPEDGFAVIAIGLGAYVVGGEKTYRFCPRYPKLQLASFKDLMRDTQKYFYAVDLQSSDYNLKTEGEFAAIKRYDIKEAESDGCLQYCASVYDFLNDRIGYDFNEKGCRILNFPGLLEYEQIPLPGALNVLLDIFSQAMGSPVEIEFSLDLEDNEPTLYLLQIKPLIKNDFWIDIDQENIDPQRILLRTSKGLGHGKLVTIQDVIYIDPEKFNRLKTQEMAEEIKSLNKKLTQTNTFYLLIGPGRWGTRDPLTGIPVNWSDISNAKVIIEQGLQDFPLDASLGSHFFHNVTSMHIGYFAVPFENKDSFINFQILHKQDKVEELQYTTHIRFENPLTILMDGKKQIIMITY